jgi:hypothetical protein
MPSPPLEYKYDPNARKLDRVRGPVLSPGQINAERVALGAAGLLAVGLGTYAVAVGAASLWGQISEWLELAGAAAAG